MAAITRHRRCDAPKGRDTVGLIVLALAGLYFASLRRYGLHITEEGDSVYLIYRTFSGQRPYLDFGSAYTPLYFFGNAMLFEAFGVDVMVLRTALAGVNALAVFALYRIARLVLPASMAAVPALAYLALMPVMPGEAATFNIPYPGWYVVLTCAAATLALIRFCGGGSAWWALLAGALSGLGCGIKPNTGAFGLAALVTTLLLLAAGNAGRRYAVAWWAMLAAVLASVTAVFGFQPLGRDARLLLWPVYAVAAVCVWARRARPEALLGPARSVLGAAAVLAGFAVTTVPWMAYYLAKLGIAGFGREVLFIGGRHAQAFRIPIRDLDHWDSVPAIAVLAAMVVTWVGAGRGLRLPAFAWWALGIAGSVGAAALVMAAPMPEGFVPAVIQRVRHASFGAALVVHAAGIAVLAYRIGRLTVARMSDASNIALIATAVAAPFMFLGMYPRGDFFHLVLSAPFTLLLAAMLYWQGVRRWWPAARPLAAAAPALALVVILALPGASLAARLHGASRAELYRAGLGRARVDIEAGRAGRFGSLERIVEFVGAESSAGETLLGFPSTHMLNFLSGRHVPGRYGSFFPGWPDHLVEAGVIGALDEAETPLVIVNHKQTLFMEQAPAYFFLLREYIRDRYEPAATFGSYDVLRLRGGARPPAAASGTARAGDHGGEASGPEGAPPPVTCAEAVALAARTLPESTAILRPCWRDPAERNQEQAVALARQAGARSAAVDLANALARQALGPRAALLAVRAIRDLGDATSLPGLVAALDAAEGRVADEMRTAILDTAVRSFMERFVAMPRDAGVSTVRAEARCGDAALAWMRGSDPRLRLAGAWMAGVRRDREAEGELRRLLAEPNPFFRAVAADALLQLGARGGVVEELVKGLAEDETYAPGLLLAWARAEGAVASEPLARGFTEGRARQKEIIALMAGVLGWPALAELVQAGLADPEPRVRAAAAWSAGALGLSTTLSELRRLAAADQADEVRRLAAVGIGLISRGGWPRHEEGGRSDAQ